MRNDIPYSLAILEAPEIPSRLLAELEVVYVIVGDAEIVSGQYRTRLRQYDLISLDPGLEYSIRGSGDSILVIVKYTGSYIETRLNGMTGRFILNSAAEPGGSYGRLRYLFGKLLSYDDGQHRTVSLEESIALEIFSVLADLFFDPDPIADQDRRPSDNYRMRIIMQYISSHLHENCSIAELSEILFLSPAAVSRFFKKKTGIHFSDYIHELKMKEAAREISSSVRPLSHISAELGFSNPSSFHHAFVKTYGMTPAEYRRRNALRNIPDDPAGEIPDGRTQDRSNASAAALRQRVLEQVGISGASENGTLKIRQSIDVRESQGIKPLNLKLITAGASGDLNLVNVQYHILMLQKELGIEYVRFFTPFTTKLRITDGKTRGYYNYDLLDQILDFLTNAHLKPCIDLGTRENRALRTQGDTIFVDREVILFNSKSLWEEALSSLMEHIIRRYGEKNVSQWMFEFMDMSYIQDNWPVPYPGSNVFEAYGSLYRIVKKASPASPVGGPGLMITSNTEPGSYRFDYPAALESFLKHCCENDCRPDFISVIFHLYRQKVCEYGFDAEVELLKKIKKQMSQRALNDAKIIITEWYSSVSSRNYLNDSCYRAAYFARKLSQTAGLADMISISVASDWVSNYFDSHSISNGGNGLLTKSGIEKPVFSILRFIFKMPSDLVSRGPSHYLTRNEHGELFLLCWNFPIGTDKEFELSEIAPKPKDVDFFISSHSGMELTVTLRGLLSQGKYSVRSETVSEQEGTILGNWKQFDYEEDLEEYEVRYIRNAVYPRMSTKKRQVQSTTLTLPVTLPPFSVALLSIRKSG